jgi:glycine dehydrogenase subunit 1
LGAGVYDHFIPAAVDTIVSRPEFFTAYTPYQAEVSQGTLQFIYEYQTMICESPHGNCNASMYDGASAIAEAILMAVRKNRLSKAILPATLHPEYVKVIRIYTEGLGIERSPLRERRTHRSGSPQSHDDETIGSVVLQNPISLQYRAGEAIGQIAHSNPKTLFIVAADPSRWPS